MCLLLIQNKKMLVGEYADVFLIKNMTLRQLTYMKM